ncbi:MAG: hypothetical protein AB7I19_08570 [Planctomycetota bacterium]
MPAISHWLFAIALTAGVPLAAQDAEPELSIRLRSTAVEFRIDSDKDPFVGVVIASLDARLAHYFTTLPPLLSDHVLLGYGAGSVARGFQLGVPDQALPAGILIHAQGVALDAIGIRATKVRSFLLGVTAR